MKQNKNFFVAATSCAQKLGVFVPKETDLPFGKTKLGRAVAQKSEGMRIYLDDFKDWPQKAWLLREGVEPTMENHYSLEYIDEDEKMPNFLTDEQLMMEPFKTHNDNQETALLLFKGMTSCLKYNYRERSWIVNDGK